ncbi:MAG: VOC family protein [Ignavibacteriae bacterium]|nr:VOC family protein [Ignavibacteriota bacterium]
MLKFSPHIAFQVTNYEKALAFYIDVLGFELVKHGEKESHLRLGEMNFYVEDSAKGYTFLEFTTDDIEDIKTKLENSGCQLEKTHMEKSFMVEDPYGFRFHVWQK